LLQETRMRFGMIATALLMIGSAAVVALDYLAPG